MKIYTTNYRRPRYLFFPYHELGTDYIWNQNVIRKSIDDLSDVVNPLKDLDTKWQGNTYSNVFEFAFTRIKLFTLRRITSFYCQHRNFSDLNSNTRLGLLYQSYLQYTLIRLFKLQQSSIQDKRIFNRNGIKLFKTSDIAFSYNTPTGSKILIDIFTDELNSLLYINRYSDKGGNLLGRAISEAIWLFQHSQAWPRIYQNLKNQQYQLDLFIQRD